MRRKTRFVCISDTHGYTPSEAGFKLPAGDVLIHAGDFTNKGSLAEVRRTMDWISKANFEIMVIVAGNHDVTLDPDFYAKHGHEFHGSQREDPIQCLEAVTSATPSIIYLKHQATVINLCRKDGPNTTFKVFGSPCSQFEGNWAFGYNNGKDATALWDQIPSDSDIVVTHTPPQSHCDQKPTGRNVGCNALRQALSRIRPSLAICGHVHEARGYERVCWHEQMPLSRTLIRSDSSGDITQGVLPPPGSKKQALIDLTGKRGERLDNEGFASLKSNSQLNLNPTTRASMPSSSFGSAADVALEFQQIPNENKAPILSADTQRRGVGHIEQTLRRETCIVNAAILATSWPHRGGKRFNTPIVVDLELPVRRGYYPSK
ncbi:hypothetical protein N7466_002024 [Penicillium verhagenii]|uniref:uncharacterized protein n=1 Tax=Penicillium verhagenii TaxID=1562060 RepID=UPI0025451E5B|nr:uncharacterized protein N7466_002024 [Penicillium verhagenii]KAJ5938890.1 hypothetical protein N7466_002024 [Penicillium verhagenii]